MSDSMMGVLLSPGGEVSSSPFGEMKAELVALAELLDVRPLDVKARPYIVLVDRHNDRYSVVEILRRARDAVKALPRDAAGGKVLR